MRQVIEFDAQEIRFPRVFVPRPSLHSEGAVRYGFTATLDEEDEQRLSEMVSHKMGMPCVNLMSVMPFPVFGGFSFEDLREARDRNVALDGLLNGQPARAVAQVSTIKIPQIQRNVLIPLAIHLNNSIKIPTFEDFVEMIS